MIMLMGDGYYEVEDEAGPEEHDDNNAAVLVVVMIVSTKMTVSKVIYKDHYCPYCLS